MGAYLLMRGFTLLPALSYSGFGGAMPIARGGDPNMSRPLPDPVAFLIG